MAKEEVVKPKPSGTEDAEIVKRLQFFQNIEVFKMMTDLKMLENPAPEKKKDSP